jgi:hypothetical protein
MESGPISSQGPRSVRQGVPPPVIARVAERAYNMLGSLQSRVLPAEVVMMNYINAFGISRCIFAAAELGVADLLAERGPTGVDDLAGAVGAHPDALYRVMRALASSGIFEEVAPRRFALNRLAECLRSDAPASLRPWARYAGAEWYWNAWGSFMTTVRNGRTIHENIHGKRFFEHYAENPGYTALFDEAMTSASALANHAIAAAYDFSRVRSLVDLAGGHGALLAGILTACPALRGALYERPDVIARAREAGHLRAPEIADRVELIAGDVFESVPAGYDAYLMKWILHDWDDAEAAALLANVRRAAAPGARLLIAEMVVEPGNDPSAAKLLDLAMLALTGGRERTLDEFRALLAASGFELRRARATASPYSVLEAVAV